MLAIFGWRSTDMTSFPFGIRPPSRPRPLPNSLRGYKPTWSFIDLMSVNLVRINTSILLRLCQRRGYHSRTQRRMRVSSCAPWRLKSVLSWRTTALKSIVLKKYFALVCLSCKSPNIDNMVLLTVWIQPSVCWSKLERGRGGWFVLILAVSSNPHTYDEPLQSLCWDGRMGHLHPFHGC